MLAARIGQGKHPPTPEAEEGAYGRIFEAAADGLIINSLATGLVVEANPAAAAMHAYTREEFIGLHPTTYLHPDSHPLFDEYVQAVQGGELFEGRALHLRRDGSSFEVELRGSALLYQNQPCLLGVIRDITERARAERRLRQQINARTREQSTLLEISHTLASALELKPGLILDQLRVLIEYTYAALFSLEGPALVAVAARGRRGVREATPFRIWLDDDEALARLLKGQQPTRVTDVWSAEPGAHFLQSLLQGERADMLESARAGL